VRLDVRLTDLTQVAEMGLERLNVGFLLHVLNEQSENGELNCPGMVRSMDIWWANCLRKEEDREGVRGLIRKVREGKVYTREEYEEVMSS